MPDHSPTKQSLLARFCAWQEANTAAHKAKRAAMTPIQRKANRAASALQVIGVLGLFLLPPIIAGILFFTGFMADRWAGVLSRHPARTRPATLVFATAVAGVILCAATSMLLSSAFVLATGMLVLGRWQGRGWPRAVAGAAAPVAILAAVGLMLGVMITNNSAEISAQQVAILAQHRAAVAEDAAAFSADLQAGTLRAEVMDVPRGGGWVENDALGEWLLRKGFALGVAGRAEVAHMNAALPFVDLLFGARIVQIMSGQAMTQMVERNHAGQMAAMGADYATWPTERLMAWHKDHPEYRANNYKGILMASCIFRADGALMSATGMAGAYSVDLQQVAEATPILEACRAFAPGQTPPPAKPLVG